MNEKEIKLKVLEAMKQAMMEDIGKKGADTHKPKGMLVIEKEEIAVPKEKLEEESEEGSLEEALAGKEEMESPEEDDFEGGDLLEKIKELRKAKKEKLSNIG